MLHLANTRHLPVTAAGRGIRAGDLHLPAGERLDCGPEIGTITGDDLGAALGEDTRRTRGGYRPQLAALVFFATGRPRALVGYFPLTRTLPAAEIDRLYQLVSDVAEHGNLDLRLIDEGGQSIAIPADTAFMVAGQIAEIFFFRQDILERLVVQL
jgi:hypothetical protein